MRAVIRRKSLTSREKAKTIARFALDKKAEDITILDMRKLVNFCDYFVICSGNSDRQVKAIADGIEEGLQELGVDTSAKDGLKDCSWVVFDNGDVVTHIFQKDIREFYSLEYLWQKAKVVKW